MAQARDDHLQRAVLDAGREDGRHRAARDHGARARRYRLRPARALPDRHEEGARADRRGARRLLDLLGDHPAPRRRRRLHRGPRHDAVARPSCTRKARQKSAKAGVPFPSFDEFWEAGIAEARARTASRSCSPASAPIPTANPLKTPSGKIEIFSEKIASFGYDDCPGHAVWLEPIEWLGSKKAERYPLHMLSDQPTDKLHSQLDHSPHAKATKVKGRQPITMHPEDAAARGIADGDLRARVQRPRRLPRRRARQRPHPPRRRAPVDRRLVRPGDCRARTRRSRSTAIPTRSRSTSAPPSSARAASPRPAWSRSSASTARHPRSPPTASPTSARPPSSVTDHPSAAHGPKERDPA